MPRELVPVEVNRFVGGLNSDIGPLSPSENFSLDERNMVLNGDGSRNRRLGMDYEAGAEIINSNSSPSSVVNYFKWENAGGHTDRNILVVQINDTVRFFDLSAEPVSSGLFPNVFSSGEANPRHFSFASVNGLLVIAYNSPSLRVYDFDGESIYTVFNTERLKIRDMFGVEDRVGSMNLYEGSGLQYRPKDGELTAAHQYNLRNQTFGIPRPYGAAESDDAIDEPRDPIRMFWDDAECYPSNSDSVNMYLYADPSVQSNRTLERFFPNNLYLNPLGSGKTAQGYFIIDALERGKSRYEEYLANQQNYPDLEYNIGPNDLPTDRTPGGPKVVAQYAGRAWFGGFSSEIVGGDEHSPRMSSYVLFSRLVSNPSDIFKCYQEGDPTSRYNADVVDTDGGFIRIDEASGISKMYNIGDSLIILAENGIWRISGTSDNGFTATSFQVAKITEKGCISPSAVVEVDNTLFYWSADGIYHIRPNEFGELISAPIIVNRLQNFYNDISYESKVSCIGAYDKFQRKVKWVYDNNYNSSGTTKELVFDVVLQAFYVNDVRPVDQFPRLVAVMDASEYVLHQRQDQVMVGNAVVEVGDDPVVIDVENISDVERGNLLYMVVTRSSSDGIGFTFANYTDEEFVDWRSYNGEGIDAEAYLVTSYYSGEDFQRKKRITYMTVHLRKTEIGFELDGGNLVPVNPSSCIVQTRWDWSNSIRSGQWGRPFQAYRHRRWYMPSNLEDTFDNGYSTVVSRNKIRGGGRVLSVRFSTEPKKNFHLDGWSMIVSVEQNV